MTIVLLFFVFASFARASIVVKDLEWDLRYNGSSYNEVEAWYAPGNFLYGWRHATEQEVLDLLLVDPGYQSLVYDTLPDGTYKSVFSVDEIPNGGRFFGVSIGMYAAPPSATTVDLLGVSFTRNALTNSDPVEFGPVVPVGVIRGIARRDSRELTFRHWLVRPVPEPASVAVWGLLGAISSIAAWWKRGRSWM